MGQKEFKGVAGIALHRDPRGRLSAAVGILLICTTTVGRPAFAQGAATACAQPIARVVSVQGSVDIQRAGSSDWLRINRLDAPLCANDRLRAGALSRAALFVQPETLVRVDQNTTIALSVTTTEILVEFFQDNVNQAGIDAHSCGAGYFITRFPKKFRVSAPHLNAAVEGTEFSMSLRCDATQLAVLEGAVGSEVVATREARTLTGGQTLTAGPSGSPAFSTLIKPIDAVQWALHFPPLSDAKGGESVGTAEQCHSLPVPSDETCLAQRAEALLRLGRTDEALTSIDEVLAQNAGNGDANALRAIIQIAKNDKGAALDSATAATTAAANSMRAWLALSYAQQSSFELELALQSARKAQASEPNSSLVNARVAELLMSLGRIGEAELAARAGVSANPNESGAHTMLGFVHLAQIDTRQARADFEAAIEHDSFNPLPRLGLGLAIIREGKLVEGREQIEIAVSLDPTSSLLRSYVGKAYYEENTKDRDELAAMQLDLAKQLDPNDPTPWFYGAILKQTQNRPIDSLEDVQKSVELNDNRTVYRSRLLLDQDLAARNVRLAASYRELGFEQLAQAEAYRSLEMDPEDFSAHRFLADAFAGRPRHQIARVSEALQSQLWQPLNVTPIETQLIDDRSFILRDSGPSTVGFNEYNPLFVQQGVQLQASGVIGDNDTLGDQILLSGIHNRLSASVGQFYYDTDGSQKGWGLKKNILSAFVQGQISAESSVFGEYRNSDQTQGDLSQNFFGVTDSQRLTQDRELYRLGFHFPLGGWGVAGTFTGQDGKDTGEFPAGSLAFTSDANETAGELLAAYRSARLHLVLGGGWYDTTGTIEFFGSKSESNGTAGNAFAYAGYELIANVLRVDLGVSWDEVDQPGAYPKRIDRVSPKLGIVFSPRPGTTFRAAAFRGLRRSLIAEQTVEPTQVAGFNQFYDDVIGTKAERIGIGWDQELTATSFVGIELSKRRLEVPQAFTDPLETFEWKERDYRAYLSLAPYRWLSTTLEYTYERLTEQPLFAENFLEAETQKIPLNVSFFLGPSGVALRTTVTHVRQTGEFRLDPSSSDFVPGTSDFWIADVALTYRLPRRHGLISGEIRNVFDKTFNYQETDVFTPTLARERLAFLRVSFVF